MTDTLHILHGDTPVGRLAYERRRDEISLSYDESWRFGRESFPVSLSLPLAKTSHPDAAIRPFLQGLLPDNPAVIEAWGKRFQVSPRNPFDIIRQVGEDCAGALQFIRPERLELILSGRLDSLAELSEEALARRMSDLQTQSRAIAVPIDGRFSLAGAQTKDALHFKDGRWHVPAGRIPSTHILKPQLEDFEEHALNEHFCLHLAAAIGLSAAESRILEVAGGNVLCVKRYDRVLNPARHEIVRVHQEDTCQATGRYPHQKYQPDGGASAAEIVSLLDRFADDPRDDIDRFVMALALHWVIAGTDAHSKNYSLLHGPGSFLRLAPLYDVASFLPYRKDPKSSHLKLAMKIGGTYRLHQIAAAQWRKWALEANLSPERVVVLVTTLIERLAAALEPTRDAVAQTSASPFLHQLADRIAERAQICAGAME